MTKVDSPSVNCMAEIKNLSITAEIVNGMIETWMPHGLDTDAISDGYHTFGELYEHRIQLFIKLCWFINEAIQPDMKDEGWYDNDMRPWRAKKPHDGSGYEGWFIMGLGKKEGEQITYHLPLSRWDECYFAETLEVAPPWDGHSSQDVLERLKGL